MLILILNSKSNINPTQGQLGFITVEDLMLKYKVSRTAINNKSKKYKIERRRAGKQNLVNEIQFLEFLKHKEPKPECFK
jgi:hypothetical protein